VAHKTGINGRTMDGPTATARWHNQKHIASNMDSLVKEVFHDLCDTLHTT